ncbi:MAG: alpha/beta fold hydrolase [Emcibacteraceae bacterium]|nr:alpha/beta fold hydrolase [Emcibacteraceae bacterium]MDG1995177.1 alpha/beta fold hydrolase [Emcibacteraceae bacterium]
MFALKVGMSSLVDVSYIDELPIIWNGPEHPKTLLILAHGAGAPMDTDFMNFFAQELSEHGIRVLRFEFPYMALRREGYGKRPPNVQKILLSSWKIIIEAARQVHHGKVYIGGKSMGGRMASMVADDCEVDGAVCLGYPFYAPGKLDKPRIEHLERLQTPLLILQGERDTMGSRDIVGGYSLSDKIDIHWLPDGDHGLKPRKKSGHTEQENLALASRRIVKFLS